MIAPSSRPRLRAVETIVVPHPEHGRALVLRDTQGVTEAHAVLPPALVPIAARFDGSRTCTEIAREATRELGVEVPVEAVVALAAELERGCFLDGPTYRAALDRVRAAFRAADVRPATHAGGAYHEDPAALRAYVEGNCLGAAGRPAGGAGGARMIALVAPHIDPWRGAVSYGHAYGALAAALAEGADTFVLLGTSHAPMREPFALCRKAYATPLGPLPADLEALDALAARAAFDPYADELNHKREHSIEFQAVFLRHLLDAAARRDPAAAERARAARAVPILAGLGSHQARGTDPSGDSVTRGFLDALRELVAARPGRIVVVAGADLAHVGPRFGDERPLDAPGRAALEARDRASLGHAIARDAGAFWSHVAEDLDTRRVCGLAPMYTLLEALAGGARGELLHYEQTVDPEEGSIVSHAAVGFYA